MSKPTTLTRTQKLAASAMKKGDYVKSFLEHKQIFVQFNDNSVYRWDHDHWVEYKV